MNYEVKCKLERVLLEEKEAGRKVNKEWLAKELGVSRQTISNYISGRYYPTLDKCLKLAELLNRKVEDLYELIEK